MEANKDKQQKPEIKMPDLTKMDQGKVDIEALKQSIDQKKQKIKDNQIVRK